MFLRRNSGTAALLAVALVVAACGAGSGADDSPVQRGTGAETAEAAVRELVDLLNEGDFDRAADLATPNHAVLASLSEGSTFAQVAEGLREGDADIASNFWSGFAQGSGALLTGDLTVGESSTFTRDGVEFDTVTLIGESGSEHTMIVRDVDGYRVDLFASFGPGLAERMIPTVERLLSTQTDDSRLILTELKEVVPSLLVAAELPGLSAESIHQIVRLVELITRVG